MKVFKSSQLTLHEQIVPIVNNVANVLNLHYLQRLVGQTHAYHLLCYIIGLLIMDKNFTMVRISEQIRQCYHDGFFRMLSGMNLAMAGLSRILIYFIEKHRRKGVKGWLIIDDTSIVKKYSRTYAEFFTRY